MKFRKDINGLRAIAVIAVLLFHFNASWIPGGFAGVDVFFVISGFLMTGIIFRGMEQNNFSILNFYVARANRIIPAMALLCLVLIVFGWFYFTPIEYENLGKHTASSVGFISNFVFWKETGYFDAASHGKWLLHTWSLSVEWQFYIIYPIILLSLRKFFSIRNIKLLLIVSTVLGFIFSVIMTYKLPNAAYYLFPTRAWEMMIGSVAYLYPFTIQDNRKKVVEFTGLILIIASYFLISEENLWPGYLAIFPVIGSFFIIQAQRNDSFLTGNIVFQKLGAWSYSIYLWHWPLVVAIYTFSLPDHYIYIGLVLSVLLGFLSYKYIESIKFSKQFHSFSDYLSCYPIYLAIIVIIIGNVLILNNGFISRFNLTEKQLNMVDELVIPDRKNGYCFYQTLSEGFVENESEGVKCYLGNQKDLESRTLLFGDSYAGHSEPFLDEIFKANKASFQSITTNSCHPVLSDIFEGSKNTPNYNQCMFNRSYVRKNLEKYDNIILAARWKTALEQGVFEEIEKSIVEMANNDLEVFIIPGAYQYSQSFVETTYRAIYFNDPLKLPNNNISDQSMIEANLMLKKIAEENTKVHFIERDSLYGKKTIFESNGITLPYSLDGGHLSILSSKQWAKNFMKSSEYDNFIENTGIGLAN